MATRAVPRKRRTQAERRQETTQRLRDAAVEALIELGYASATVQEICDRAGVSQGGLFRHYPTREALMVAVGRDIGSRLLAQYRRKFASGARSERGRLRIPPAPASARLVLALRLVREQCRSRLNQAWFELNAAARSNARLRRALRPFAQEYHDAIRALGRELLPELAAALGPRFDVLVDTVIAVFDGETLHRFLRPEPELEDARLEVAEQLLTWVLEPGQAEKGLAGVGGRRVGPP